MDAYSKDFIVELQHDLEMKDFNKARYVLNQLDLVDEVTQGQAVMALSDSEEGFVIPLITDVLARRQDLAGICPSLRQVLQSKALSGAEEFIRFLEMERNTDRKIVLVETAGKIQMKQAVPVLKGFLKSENDERLLKQTIKSAQQ